MQIRALRSVLAKSLFKVFADHLRVLVRTFLALRTVPVLLKDLAGDYAAVLVAGESLMPEVAKLCSYAIACICKTDAQACLGQIMEVRTVGVSASRVHEFFADVIFGSQTIFIARALDLRLVVADHLLQLLGVLDLMVAHVY